jgi:hypothetical protein
MRKDRKIIWVIIVAGLMVSSVFGVIFGGFSSPTETVRYNKYKFERINNYWVTKIGNMKIGFQYLPNELDDIYVDKEALNRLSSSPMIYITYDPSDKYRENIAAVQFQLGKALNDNFNIFVATAFIKNSTYKIPIITCANSTKFVPVIEFITTNTTQIKLLNNSCIISTAKSAQDFYRIRDRILYGLFEVIK